jgi:hypothetical protein
MKTPRMTPFRAFVFVCVVAPLTHYGAVLGSPRPPKRPKIQAKLVEPPCDGCGATTDGAAPSGFCNFGVDNVSTRMLSGSIVTDFNSTCGPPGVGLNGCSVIVAELLYKFNAANHTWVEVGSNCESDPYTCSKNIHPEVWTSLLQPTPTGNDWQYGIAWYLATKCSSPNPTLVYSNVVEFTY